MTRSMPYLALDSAGERTILCDYPVKMFDNTTKKETAKMNKTLSSDQLSRYVGMRIRNPAAADRYWDKCRGRNIAVDAAMDDETAEKLKGFLKSRLSAEDHEQVCNMLAGGDVDAEDDLPENAAGGPLPKNASLAGDSAGFAARFPGLSHVRIDNSGIQPRKRPASGGDVADFNARFPGLAKVKLA
jgi:hypothetical protein